MSKANLVLGIVVAILVFLLGLGIVIVSVTSKVETGSAALSIASTIGGLALMGLSVYGARKWALYQEKKLDQSIELRDNVSRESSIKNTSLADPTPI